MKAPPIPGEEERRLAALHALCVLDSPPEDRFDRITRLAAECFQVPICLVSLVDRDRQWFKSRHGLEAKETPREVSFCGHAICEHEPFIIENALDDERFADNPLVAGEMHLRFYAGAQLRSSDGHTVGTLCLLDSTPRTFDSADRKRLDGFVRLVESELRSIEATDLQSRVLSSQRELRIAKARAEEASEAKSSFLASMSHELRTPLNAVIGFANVLARGEEGQLSPQGLEYLQRIRANGEHLLHLVNEILDLSRIEVGAMELARDWVDVQALCRGLLNELESLATQRGLGLHLEGGLDLAPVLDDPHRLRQILTNLIANAIKFTESGSVTVRICGVAGGPPDSIEVVDTGPGIAEEDQEEIFEAFHRLEAARGALKEGTGLGLAISASLCRQMGHRIEVQSAAGQGSTFRIWLNVANRNGARRAEGGY